MSAQQLANNPGYARTPTSQTLYFGERGAGSFAGYGARGPRDDVDDPGVALDGAVAARSKLLNVLNNQKLISWDTTVTADTKGALDEYGLPRELRHGAELREGDEDDRLPAPARGHGRRPHVPRGVRRQDSESLRRDS